MSFQAINIGAVSNDGTGDTIRSAFNKANQNFADLYGFSVGYFGAKGDGSDATSAFTAAINAANAATSAGVASNIFIPPGIYVISSLLPAFFQNTGVVGSGQFKSIIKLSTAFSGDLFQWSEAWAQNFFSHTTVTLPCKTGPMARDFSIVGDRTSANVQNCLMLYDRNDEVLFENIDMFNVNGQCISAGTLKNSTVAALRESRFRNLRSFDCGQVGGPAVLSFGAVGGLAGTPVYFDTVDIYAPWSTGFSINNKNTNTSFVVRGFYFDKLRIEGAETNDRNVDLLTIGEVSDTASVGTIHLKNTQLISPQSGKAAIRLTSGSLAIAPGPVIYEGGIFAGGGTGSGAVIERAKGPISFKCSTFASVGTNLIVPSTSNMSGKVLIDCYGSESLLTKNIDATMTANVLYQTRLNSSGITCDMV